MQDEWTNVGRGGQLMKFTYSDELPQGKVFLTAQIAGHEVSLLGHFAPAGTPVQS
jgi:hypothetical protein